MDFYTEPQRKLPIIAKTDVLICGGGPAGVGAALRSARTGAKTMLIEALDALGGMATSGMMSHWVGRSSSKIMQEIFKRTNEKNQTLGYAKENEADEIYIHHESQKIVLDEMMKESSVELMYYTFVCGAVVNDGRLCGVIVENKSGRGVVLAKCVVDSTGDGDVAAFAGVPFFKGRESDGRMQPCSIMFKVGGVDYSRAVFPCSFETLVDTPKGELQALAKKILPFPAGHVLLYRQPTKGTVCCNMTNAIEIDGTNGNDLTKALITCRSQIEPIVKFLQEYVPGYENCWLMSSAHQLGVRETRHFEGMSSLTADDILQARVHDDWVVRRAYFNFDVHNLTGSSLDKTGVQHKFTQKNDYSIPYGCLLPKNVEGLLLSGRNISGSHLAHSNFRNMPTCCALGEAAGAAAALSVQSNCRLRDVDVKQIQSAVGE